MYEDIDISMCKQISGWMSDSELVWLARTASYCDRIVEVGSWCGKSSLAIASHLTPNGHLYCVDAWEQKHVDANMGNANAEEAFASFRKNLVSYINSNKVCIMRNDSLKCAEILMEVLGPRSVDWVFIDGSHDYETVKSDIKAYAPLLRIGGLLSGHDYWHADVHRAVHELIKTGVRNIPGGSVWSCMIRTNGDV